MCGLSAPGRQVDHACFLAIDNLLPVYAKRYVLEKNSLPVQTKHPVTNSALLATNSAAKKKVQTLKAFRCFFWLLEIDVVIQGPEWPLKVKNINFS